MSYFYMKIYIFFPIVIIIRFYHSTHLRLFYTIRVTTCLWGDLKIKTLAEA